MGIENARIVPGFAEASFFDLYNFPFSHSLLGTLFMAFAAYLVFQYCILRFSQKTKEEKNQTSLLVGVAVSSHYFLDFLVHTPDLLIIPGIDLKIGLGLWNFCPITLLLELTTLLGGYVIYFRVTRPGEGVIGKYAMGVFMVVLLLTSTILITPVPPPGLEITSASFFLILLLLTFAGVAYWLDRTRAPISG
ncbi:MAG: hypothetical protein ACFFFG_10685 [Candidatus Thorarchaeota archaeon]